MRYKIVCMCGLIVLSMMFIGTNLVGAWDDLTCSSPSYCPRFAFILNSDGILDRDTGLVWEQSPSMSTVNWPNAVSYCHYLTKGHRMGWRLPSLEELQSLIDTTQSNPPLPPGHPFFGVQLAFYWSATDVYGFPVNAWGVSFTGTGVVGNNFKTVTDTRYAWCVRGGQGFSAE